MSAVKGARKGKLLEMRLRGQQVPGHGKRKEALLLVSQRRMAGVFLRKELNLGDSEHWSGGLDFCSKVTALP